MTFTVLFVCTGNVCRSPSAELLFRASTGERADVSVLSAGTHALVGEPIDASTARVLARLGFDPSLHRGTQFAAAMAQQADLVLTAARQHRDFVITEAPTAYRRTFTMKEFARLVHAIPAGTDPHDVVAAAHLARPVVGPVEAREDDIPDPYRADMTRAWNTAEQVVATVGAAAGALGFLQGGTAPDAVPAGHRVRRGVGGAHRRHVRLPGGGTGRRAGRPADRRRPRGFCLRLS